MFRKLKYFLMIAILTQSIACANYNDIYIADIQYDWIKKSDVEKDAIISEVHDIVFANEMSVQKELKKEYKELKKDKNRRAHYLAASAGYKEYDGYNISAFYYNKNKNIYMYALQDKKDLSKKFYYDALGNLRYIDFISEAFPDFPYSAYQYRISGKPVSAAFYVSKDTQYIFSPDGTFAGVWYKNNLYSKDSKIILRRTTY